MKPITVIGSINMDVVLRVGTMPAAGANIYATTTEKKCGGKGANAAISMQKLGIPTLFFACVGSDAYGGKLKQNLKDMGVSPEYIVTKDTVTGVAYIIVEDSGDNRIIVAPGANEAVTVKDIHQYTTSLIEQSDFTLIQLEITEAAIEEIISVCKEKGTKLIVDAGPMRGIKAEQLAGVYCISPNESELGALLDRQVETMDEIKQAAHELLEYDVECVLVKLGNKGSYYIDKKQEIFQEAYKVHAIDTTAAGDSFMAGFCFSLNKGDSIEEALVCASKCGAIAVTRRGASPSVPSQVDLENFESFLMK